MRRGRKLGGVSYFVKRDPDSLVSGFGDPLAAELTPRVQIDAVYGVIDTDVQTITRGAGTVTEADATFVIESGAGAGDYAVLRSRRIIRYRPGQASRLRFTAAFDATSDPAAYQGAGGFTATDALLVLAIGGQIGVCRRIPGTLAIWRLTVSAGTTGAEDVTVRLNGVDFLVAGVNAATPTALATALAGETYAGWTSAVSPTANGATVTFIQNDPAATGTDFILSSAGTAAGTFAEIAAGAPSSYADFRPQSAWNLDTLDGSEDGGNPSHFELDPTKLNVYQIEHTHLGTGPITWSVLSQDGRWIAFHRERFPNTRTTATQKNPTYRLGWFAFQPTGGASAIVRGASAAAFVAGSTSLPLRNPFAVGEFDFTATTTPAVAIALRLRGEFRARANQREVFAEIASAATETANRTLRMEVWLNPTPSAPLVWSYVDQDRSVMEVARPGSISPITISGGRLLAALPIATGSGGSIDLEDLDIRTDIGDVIVIALATAANTAASSAAVTWRED